MKKGFSMMEMIFAVVIVGIIATIAVPKLLGSKDDATVATLNQDIQTVISSVQTYHMINGSVDKISDAVVLNSSVWDIPEDGKSISFKEDGSNNNCIDITISDSELSITINEDAADNTICQKLYDKGVRSNTITLN